MARKIELKTVPLTMPGATEAQRFGYANQIVEMLRQPQGQQGVSMAEMLEVMPVLAKFQDIGDAKVLILEDAHYDIVMARLATFRFPFVDQVIVTFIEDLKAAPEFEIGAVPEPEAEAT